MEIDTELQPANLSYSLQLLQGFTVLEPVTTIELVLILKSGGELELNRPVEDRIRLGAKFYKYPQPLNRTSIGELLEERRLSNEHRLLREGEPNYFRFDLEVLKDCGGIVVNVDLVKEGRFWFSNIGHESLWFEIRFRPVLQVLPNF